ncbi:MAG: type IV pilus secretin PilQ [Gammaproteobacteria bacterium]|nr:type IV pilus secretin PilQ [Gammaproteobacteria bacterium]MBV9698449.1 type IV pilus secretin PilQ [Gammaproteobacteria bacterium]
MNRFLGAAAWLALGVLGMLLGAPALAADQPALQAIDVQPLAGQQLQLTMRLSGAAPQPLSFTIDNPARISLDLPNTSLALPSRRIDVHAAGLDTILAAETKDRTRLVLNLDKLVPYETRVDGNNIIVTLGASGGAAMANAITARAAPVALGGGGRELRAIDFRRSADGAGRVIVRLSDPHTHINLHQVGNQIVVDFADAAVPANLARRYDATDYGTPVSGFDVTRAGNGSRISISANGDYEQLAYQSDDQYVVEVAPRHKPANAVDDKPVYTGERLTLNFQDIETRAVLQLLADASGQNIVVSDSVNGNVTLRLQNVPWDQALDIVLRTKGLDKRRQDNVIIVAPQAELAAREKAELAAHKDVQELAPLRSEYLQVNYAKAKDMESLIKSTTNSLLSPRGSVAVDERTNTLLLQDTSERIADIRRLVATLDIPVRQVLIEARIVIVNDDFQRDLGARFGFTNWQKNGQSGLVSTTGTAAGTDTAMQQWITSQNAINNAINAGTTPVPLPVVGIPAAANRYNINLPVSNPAGSFALGILGNNFIVDLELSAAQAETQANIISSPRVITANQKEATIEQGVEIPYQQSASSGATTIQFKKAVLSLKVTPQITPDNRIILDLDVHKDSVGTVIVTSSGVNVPSIDTRAITTQVLVNDGQTVVLGGILETTQREDDTKVPYLGDIPVLGHLFKQTSHKDDKDELMIFITPKIVREGVNVVN